jgi:hypothetical protein
MLRNCKSFNKCFIENHNSIICREFQKFDFDSIRFASILTGVKRLDDKARSVGATESSSHYNEIQKHLRQFLFGGSLYPRANELALDFILPLFEVYGNAQLSQPTSLELDSIRPLETQDEFLESVKINLEKYCTKVKRKESKLNSGSASIDNPIYRFLDAQKGDILKSMLRSLKDLRNEKFPLLFYSLKINVTWSKLEAIENIVDSILPKLFSATPQQSSFDLFKDFLEKKNILYTSPDSSMRAKSLASHEDMINSCPPSDMSIAGMKCIEQHPNFTLGTLEHLPSRRNASISNIE